MGDKANIQFALLSGSYIRVPVATRQKCMAKAFLRKRMYMLKIHNLKLYLL